MSASRDIRVGEPYRLRFLLYDADNNPIDLSDYRQIEAEYHLGFFPENVQPRFHLNPSNGGLTFQLLVSVNAIDLLLSPSDVTGAVGLYKGIITLWDANNTPHSASGPTFKVS